MTEERRSRDAGDAIRDGVRTVTGVLGALVETLEHTFNELREGGVDSGGAREAARSTIQRAQETVEDLKDRLDFVPRREFEALKTEVAELRKAIESLGVTPARAPTEATSSATTAEPPEPAKPGSEPEAPNGFPIDEG